MEREWGQDEVRSQKNEAEISLKYDHFSPEYPLAHKYFEQHQYKFYPYEAQGDQSTWKCTNDTCNNAICYRDEYEECDAEKSEYKGDEKGKQVKQQAKDISNKRFNLATEIEKNAELFGQLEAIVLKVPKEQFIESDVKLLVQTLIYTTKDKTMRDGADLILMDDNAPLCKLGLIPPLNKPCNIYASPNRAVVCHLFKELCTKAELDNVKLYFYKDTEKTNTQQAMPGCIGVITEQADLDSAVDTFLNATTWHPWKLQTIYIQESVFESVKKAFEWKCSASPDDPTVLQNGNKKFIFDYFSKSEGVNVEAFRTTKELISILCDKDPPFVSLWCNDVGVANEICFASSANESIIWVNSFGIFDGPARASEALYSAFELNTNKNITKIKDVYSEKLYKLRETWLKNDVTQRADFLIEAVPKIASNDRLKTALEYWTHCKKNSKENNNFVHVTPNSLVIGEQKSLIVVTQGQFFDEVLKALVEGVMVIYKPGEGSNEIEDHDLAKSLAKIGVPIVFWDDKVATKKTVRVATDVPFMVTRVIRHSF